MSAPSDGSPARCGARSKSVTGTASSPAATNRRTVAKATTSSGTPREVRPLKTTDGSPAAPTTATARRSARLPTTTGDRGTGGRATCSNPPLGHCDVVLGGEAGGSAPDERVILALSP